MSCDRPWTAPKPKATYNKGRALPYAIRHTREREPPYNTEESAAAI